MIEAPPRGGRGAAPVLRLAAGKDAVIRRRPLDRHSQILYYFSEMRQWRTANKRDFDHVS